MRTVTPLHPHRRYLPVNRSPSDLLARHPAPPLVPRRTARIVDRSEGGGDAGCTTRWWTRRESQASRATQGLCSDGAPAAECPGLRAAAGVEGRGGGRHPCHLYCPKPGRRRRIASPHGAEVRHDRVQARHVDGGRVAGGINGLYLPHGPSPTTPDCERARTVEPGDPPPQPSRRGLPERTLLPAARERPCNGDQR